MVDLMALRIQAETGDVRAQVAMANILLLGRDAKHDPQAAMRLLQAACARNDDDALMLHAVLALIGFARPQNFDDAHKLLARAAAAGNARAEGQLKILGGASGFDLAAWRARPNITVQSQSPRVFTIKNFIPKPACDWLIGQSRDRMGGAPVMDSSAGGFKLDAVRTSSARCVGLLTRDLVVHMINLRIAAATQFPLSHQEQTNILCYDIGQQYRPHFDFFAGDEVDVYADEIAAVGQRVGTLLIYLNDGYEGGETAFPRLDFKFKGAPGDALLFWNVSAAGEPEAKTLHAGLPVTDGQKWLLSKWIRAKPIPMSRYAPSAQAPRFAPAKRKL